MGKKKKDYMSPAKDALGTTVGLTVGTIGLGVVHGVSAPLAGTVPGTIIRGGAEPLFATGLLAGAGKYAVRQTKGKKKKRR